MPPRDRRIVPTVGVRLVRLARNVAGARLLVLDCRRSLLAAARSSGGPVRVAPRQ
jgi:hypothetical protein